MLHEDYGGKEEDKLDWLYVFFAVALDVVVHHVARAVDEFETGMHDARIEVGEDAYEVFDSLPHAQTTGLGFLSAVGTVVSLVACVAVQALDFVFFFAVDHPSRMVSANLLSLEFAIICE